MQDSSLDMAFHERGLNLQHKLVAPTESDGVKTDTNGATWKPNLPVLGKLFPGKCWTQFAKFVMVEQLTEVIYIFNCQSWIAPPRGQRRAALQLVTRGNI